MCEWCVCVRARVCVCVCSGVSDVCVRARACVSGVCVCILALVIRLTNRTFSAPFYICTFGLCSSTIYFHIIS